MRSELEVEAAEPSFVGRWAFLIGLLAAGALAVIRAGFPPAPPSVSEPDRGDRGLVLWAWERPEDLSFADPARVSIAFLAGTVRLRGDEVLVLPRRQPLRVAPRATVIPVVRLETDRVSPPSLTASQAARAAEAIAGLMDRGADVVQVEFDATASQRAFYRLLLVDLRKILPRDRKISITALASWCEGDRWLAGLPIDEAVPMLFRMGPEGPSVLRRVSSGRPFADPMCRGSVGVSTDEGVGWERRAATTYVFHPRAWTEEAVNGVLRRRRRIE